LKVIYFFKSVRTTPYKTISFLKNKDFPPFLYSFTLVQLPNGMIATKEMLKRWALPENKIEFVHGEENEETNKFIDCFTEQKRSRAPERQEKKEKQAERKNKESCKRQLSLFDD